jgi:hypothetical protein
MKINSGSSDMGLQHMAARAQGARLSRAAAETLANPATPVSDAKATENRQNLPPISGAEASSQKPDHATGLERAIENVQQNAEKNPEAKGLQQALETLIRNQEKSGAVDIKA